MKFANVLIRRVVMLTAIVAINIGCSDSSYKKRDVVFQLDRVSLNCDTMGNERGRIVFTLNVHNNSDKSIIVADTDQINPKCLLISDEYFTDGIDLLVKSNSEREVIESGKSAKINVLLEYEKLKHELMHYGNRDIYLKDVRFFLENTNYYILYSTIKDSSAYFVTKHLPIKCNCGYP